MGVTFYEETLDVSCTAVTPPMQQRGSGHLAVPVRRSDTVPRTRCARSEDEFVGKPAFGGVYVCQCLSLAANLGRPTKESQGQNRTGENPPSGIVGGLAET